MKTIISFFSILFIMGNFSAVKAQEEINPFPLSDLQKENILKKSDEIIGNYTSKYNLDDLEKLPQQVRDSLLCAKAIRSIILFAPDFYRDYQKPKITRILDRKERPCSDCPLYELKFFTNSEKEKFASDYIIRVYIHQKGGQVSSIYPSPYEIGIAFRPPLWEQEVLDNMKKDGIKTYFPYITGMKKLEEMLAPSKAFFDSINNPKRVIK